MSLKYFGYLKKETMNYCFPHINLFPFLTGGVAHSVFCRFRSAFTVSKIDLDLSVLEFGTFLTRPRCNLLVKMNKVKMNLSIIHIPSLNIINQTSKYSLSSSQWITNCRWFFNSFFHWFYNIVISNVPQTKPKI